MKVQRQDAINILEDLQHIGMVDVDVEIIAEDFERLTSDQLRILAQWLLQLADEKA